MPEHGGCHRGMPVRVDDTPGSGCRVDCLHRARWRGPGGYVEARMLDQEQRKLEREAATNGHPREVAEWEAAHPPAVTPRSWMTGRA